MMGGVNSGSGERWFRTGEKDEAAYRITDELASKACRGFPLVLLHGFIKHF